MTGDIGSLVRHAREQRGWSLSDAARLTKLSPGVLRAIERSDFDSLPGGMYRKAYLRTVAAEVGLDPTEIAAAYERLYEGPNPPAPAVAPTPDRLVDELTPSRRRSVVTLATLAALAVAWFALRPNPAPARSAVDSELDAMAGGIAADGQPTLATQDAQSEPVRVATPIAAPDMPLKINLTTTEWCWVAITRDGERVVYGLIEPGTRVAVEGHRLISVRLGNAAAVQLSVNGRPHRIPGAAGEVVELEFTPDDLPALTGVSD